MFRQPEVKVSNSNTKSNIPIPTFEWDFIWFFRVFLTPKDLLHNSHEYGLSFVCWVSWHFLEKSRENFLSQKPQEYCLQLLCMSMWSLRWLLAVNALWHSSHLNDFLFVLLAVSYSNSVEILSCSTLKPSKVWIENSLFVCKTGIKEPFKSRIHK